MIDERGSSPIRPYASQRRVERISQSVVQVSVGDSSVGFVQARSALLSWLSEKVGAPLGDAIQRGETGELSILGAQRLETAALTDPTYWSCRQDDQDSRLPRRTWVTEAAIAPHGNDRVLVGHRLHLVTLGEVAPYSRSVPRFMREIARQFDVYLDGHRIGLKARRAKDIDDVDELVALLTSQTRQHPVIGISSDPDFLEGRPWLVDPDAVANQVFGTAHVWMIDREASYALTDTVGRELSVFHGGVRTWRFPFSRADIGISHPLAIARRIAHWSGIGPEALHSELVDGALRFSAGRSNAEALLPPFSYVRQIAAKRAQEKAALQGKSTEELLELALTENSRLARELDDQKAETKELLLLVDEDMAKIRNERDSVAAESIHLQHRISILEEALRKQRNEPNISIPESLLELEVWALKNLKDKVILLPRALNLAKKSLFEDTQFVYKVLLFIRDKYIPMRREAQPNSKAEFDTSMKELGLELTPCFSGAGAGQFGDEYWVKWNGTNRELNMHFKGSNSRDPRFGFRCYFFWDDASKAVVIGAIPGHLTNDAS